MGSEKAEEKRDGEQDRKKVDVSFLDSENSNRSPVAFPSFCSRAFAVANGSSATGPKRVISICLRFVALNSLEGLH